MSDLPPNPEKVTRRILVADDEDAVRAVIRSQLERNGYHVIDVADGLEVLRVLQAQSADLLITDIVMPNIEGIELIGRLHREHPELPIIALSGDPNALSGKYLHVAGKIGARRTLHKPFKAADLLAAVRELVPD